MRLTGSVPEAEWLIRFSLIHKRIERLEFCTKRIVAPVKVFAGGGSLTRKTNVVTIFG